MILNNEGPVIYAGSEIANNIRLIEHATGAEVKNVTWLNTMTGEIEQIEVINGQINKVHHTIDLDKYFIKFNKRK